MNTEYIEKITGYNRSVVTNVLNAFQRFVEFSLRQGEEVKLENFATITFRDLPARDSRNPRTGESIIAEGKRKPKIKFSKNFESLIQSETDKSVLGAVTAPLAASVPAPTVPVSTVPALTKMSESTAPAPSAVPAPPTPPTPPAVPTVSAVPVMWFASINNQVSEIPETKLISRGLTPTSLVWRKDYDSWKPANQVAELKYIFEGQ